MISPSISIIVPCYKQAQYLSECLQSVLEQSYTNWECIIVNDGSTDNCEEIANDWLQKDTRFRYISKENGGVSSARNIGINEAKGEFILPLDADDKIGRTYVDNGIKAFRENSSLQLVYCNAEKFGEEKGLWKLPDFSLNKLSSDNLIFCSAIYKKSDWELAGGYDENMISGLEDWDFWITLLKYNGSVIRIEEIGFYYRIKISSRQQDLRQQDKRKLFEYLSIKHADFFVSQKGSFMSLEKEIAVLKTESYKNISSKKKATKVFLKAFLGINFFK